MQSFFAPQFSKLEPVHGGHMQERRKQTRKSLMSYSQVFDLYGGAMIGYLADLTASGAMVIGQKAIEAGTEMTLQFEVPELVEVTVRKLTLPARVKWCNRDISPEYQNIGFEFKEVRAEQMKVILAIIETYEFRREAPRYPSPPTSQP
jgi:hypothetical protein